MSNKQKIQNIYRLTPMQEGMLFHSLAHGQSGAYFEQRIFSISGSLDPDILERAFQWLVQRYDILRTIFRHQNVQEPLQVVIAERTFKLHIEDISHLPADKRDEVVVEFASSERQKGFDLSRDLLVRGSLFRTGAESYKLIWSYHHILMDAWCWGILFKDLIHAYRCLKKEVPIDLKPVQSYGLYIRWLEKRNKEKGLEFWHSYLDGYDTIASIPHTKNPQAQADYQLGERYFTLPDEDRDGFDTIAKEYKVTRNILFQTIWGLLLQKYNITDDVVFGAVVSGRPPEIPGVEDMVGLFINTVPVRVKRGEGMTFAGLLKRMGDVSAGSREFEFVPLPLVQAQTPLKGNLLDHIIGFQNYPGLGDVQGSNSEDDLGFRLTDMKAHEQTNYNFNIMFIPGGDSTIKFGYNRSVFDLFYVKQVERHFLNIVSQAVREPNIAIDDIQLITPEEKFEIIESFNSPRSDSPDFGTIPQMFSLQAEKTPGRIAVSSPIDFTEIRENPRLLGNCIFTSAKHWITRKINDTASGNDFYLLKTPRHHSLLANRNVLELVLQLGGENRLDDVLLQMNDPHIQFLYCSIKAEDLLEVTFDLGGAVSTVSAADIPGMRRMFLELYSLHLIEPVGYREEAAASDALDMQKFETGSIDMANTAKELLLQFDQNIETGGVLLVGDTPGQPSVGLLYLASYLRRNGIPAYAQVYDSSDSEESFRKNLEVLIRRIQPKVIAVSLKWFLYIARVLRTCVLIKKIAPEATVAVGGNTASYYWQELIKHECIDMIVRGDGEEPLLQICQGTNPASIPNIVFRDGGQVIENPFTYIQNKTNSGKSYLSHLEDVMAGQRASFLGSFFIPTHKGCRMNCCFCGGCNAAQKRSFNRKDVLQRDPLLVRTDIEAAIVFTTTFQFDFERAGDNLLNYCREILEGLDLTNHFCIVATLLPPDKELMNFFCETFKYVYFDVDITTFSQRHRQALEGAALVKPQPADDHILEAVRHCDALPNAEVRVNLITGLPLFIEDDVRESEQMFARLSQSRSSFFELHWARLHAQPGAPIIEKAAALGMHAYARTFEDFLDHSRSNYSSDSRDPTFETFQYPYIYYIDQGLNSRITRFYTEINRNMQHYLLEASLGYNLKRALTYSQLDRKSGQLAHALTEKGIGRGDIVAILSDNSIETIVAILAVLKTGAAYLPADSQYPDERIKFMIEDSNACLLLSRSAAVSGKSFGCDIMNLDSPESYHLDPLPGDIHVEAADGAYCIYTSGTSGRSKGVLVTHANLANYVRWFSREAGLSNEDNAMLASSYAFDLGYTALYPALLNGAGLYIPTKEIYLAPGRLLDYMAANRISYIKMTPSLFTTIANHPKFSHQELPALRFAAIGGEAVIGDDIKTAYLRHRSLQVINHYGPTEATIGCVFHRIQREEVDTFAAAPVIGRAITNNCAYIMDRQRNLMPVGTAGELCVGGLGIANGYLNRPELTMETFFVSPLDGNTRMYATGDLACFLPNGTIEFLGRVDQQIKIRGYRVETGEIEAVLRRHPAVEDTVVLPVKNEGDDHVLCAYIVPVNGKSTAGSDDEQAAFLGWLTDVRRLAAQAAPGDETSFIRWFRRQLEVVDASTLNSLERMSNRAASWIGAHFDDRFRLSESERTRYKRQMLLTGWGEGKQELLKSKTVFVAGAGGGASPTIMQLALAGVGTIRVCDCDVVELSNLNRQFLHDESRIGMNKALSAELTIKTVNPHVRVIPITERLTRENVFEIVGEADVIFDMFDGQDSKFILSECAVAKGIPHIIAAMIDINAYSAIFQSPNTPCFHCIFDKKKLESIISGFKHVAGDYEKKPLPVMSTSLFMSAGFAVNEAVKYMLGLGSPAFGKFMLFNQRGSSSLATSDSYQAMTFTFGDHFKETCLRQGFDWNDGWRGRFLEELDIERDPDCPCCGPNGHHLLVPAAASVKRDANDEATQGDPSLKRVAIISSNAEILAASVIGSLKSGKVAVILDPRMDEKLLEKRLANCGARLILTDNENLDLAKKLGCQVNDQIKVSPLEDSDGGDQPVEFGMEFAGAWPALAIEGFDDGDIVLNHNEVVAAFQFEGVYPALQFLTELKGLLEGGDTTKIGAEDLRGYLNRHLPTYMVPGHFVTLDRIPLTPNGKLDKRRLPDPFEGNSPIEFVAPRNVLEEMIASISSGVLGLEKIGIYENFFEHGLDSIKAIQISSRMLSQKYKLEINDILASPTVACLAERATSAEKKCDKGPGTGVAPLTPYQLKLWTLPKDEHSRHIQAVLAATDKMLDHHMLRLALERLVIHHDALGIVIRHQNGTTTQATRGQEGFLYELDITDSPVTLDRETSGMNLSEGPLVRVFLPNKPEDRIILIEIHSFILDPVSWSIILRDLAMFYKDIERGIPYQSTSSGGSFLKWSDEFSKLAGANVIASQREYWQRALDYQVAPSNPPQTGKGMVQRESFELDRDLTRAITHDVHRAYNTETLDILMTAFASALLDWTGVAAHRIVVDEGMRTTIVEGFDTQNVCGCFSTHYPLVLDLLGRQEPGRALVYTKETLRGVPHGGAGFGLLGLKTRCDFGFAYFGGFSGPEGEGSIFSVREFRLPPAVSRETEGSARLVVSAGIVDEQLRIFYDFDTRYFSEERVKSLADHFSKALQNIADHCLAKKDSVRTASDFSATDLDQEELDDIFGYLG